MFFVLWQLFQPRPLAKQVASGFCGAQVPRMCVQRDHVHLNYTYANVLVYSKNGAREMWVVLLRDLKRGRLTCLTYPEGAPRSEAFQMAWCYAFRPKLDTPQLLWISAVCLSGIAANLGRAHGKLTQKARCPNGLASQHLEYVFKPHWRSYTVYRH